MRRCHGITAGLLLAAGSLGASAATPFQLDDIHRLADVAEPAFSPDGATVAYTVTSSDRKDDQRASDIWLVPWKGGKALQLTRTSGSEWQPRFGRDGRGVFFLSDAARDETTQL